MSLPKKTLDSLDLGVKNLHSDWSGFLKEKLNFSHPETTIHGLPHTERVLLYALMLGDKLFKGDKKSNEILAHASVFHDTRRLDDSYDVGHGARAAEYYKQFSKEKGLKYYPEAAMIMSFHDIDDDKGFEAIKKEFGEQAANVLALYKVFKDADALDRWRLGRGGLDPKYLRFPESKELLNFSKNLVKETGVLPED